MNLDELRSMCDFTDRTMLITGGAGLLGSEIACALIGCNANVVILDCDPELAQKVIERFPKAVELSAQRHIRWCEEPFQRVLSCAQSMYDELWTGATAMYKLEPAVALGGEVVIYVPHFDVVSHVHGKYIYKVGYRFPPYFLND